MAAKQITVREAAEEDLDAIATFFWEAWREAGPDAPGWAGASDKVLEELTARENLLARLGRPDRRMFIARRGDMVVGFSANRRMDSEMVELSGLVVLQSEWGKQIGSSLLDAAVEAARREGHSRMRVRTEADNERAIRFYQSRGFEYVQTLTEEIGDTTVEEWELVCAI